ncbi:MAG TPA: PIG-L deacetylase family protein [Nocardioides sp.]|jgi:LmbE family N-acetylglucosaminyl deacetylase|nr:PIG-L deacetylase family protein [Nocardioides sp.]
MLSLSLPTGATEVLCLGAHPDDIEIGCGGTLLCLGSRASTRITALVMSGTPDRVAESRAALSAFVGAEDARFLGFPDGRLPSRWDEVKQALEDHAATMPTPDLVLAPRAEDAHQDHRLLGRLAPTVWRDSLVLHYEIPKWDGDVGQPSHYVGLSEAQARRKFELLDEHFPSQRSHDWWDEELFLGLMRVRGMECRHRYAEGFFATKVLIDVGEPAVGGAEDSEGGQS